MSVRWERVDALLDEAPTVADLRAHGMALLAARRWRAAGRPVPSRVIAEEVSSSWRYHAAPDVLRRIRAACDGPIMLFKGPAVAACYPEPASRPFMDIDLLVPDPEAVQAALLESGFTLSADPADYPDWLHHLPPVHLTEIPIPVEVHGRLKWPDHLRPPSFEELTAEARDAPLGVEGVYAPDPARHALVLAGHQWAHDPLARLLRLLDIAVVIDGVDRGEIQAIADAWGMGRMWSSTARLVDSLFGDGDSVPWPMRTWARGLREVREPTVAELHLSRVLSPFAVYRGAAIARGLGAAVRGFAQPQEQEGWGRKVRRTARQVTRPSMRRSEHVDEIGGESGRRGSDPPGA